MGGGHGLGSAVSISRPAASEADRVAFFPIFREVVLGS
jgi:hypothetical protein